MSAPQQSTELGDNIEWLTELPGVAPWLNEPKVAAFIAALRAHQNLWAAWPNPETDTNKVSTAVRQGNTILPKGHFEAATRRGVVYLRYVGPKPDPF